MQFNWKNWLSLMLMEKAKNRIKSSIAAIRPLREAEGSIFLRKSFARKFGRQFDARHLQTFTEKLFGRMIALNGKSDDQFTALTDKYGARKVISEKVGDRYLPVLLWHGENPDDIPFSQLRPPYIVKTNHGSGKIIRVEDAPDEQAIRTNLRHWLSDNYYWDCREYQYLHIRPLVLIEECLDDGHADGPLDYRFWCFHGRVEVIQVDNHKHDINPFYDSNWTKLDLRYRTYAKDCDIPRPVGFDEMLKIASALTQQIDFVRVDLYNVRGRILVGEFTFTPVGGGLTFEPASWDQRLGHKWEPYSWRC